MSTRGRPKSDQKRKQILSAAIEQFQKLGFEQTSMERVAQIADVSKQTIYSHFNDKASLLEQCIAERCRESILSAEVLDYSLPPEVFLPRYAQVFLDTLCGPGPLGLWRLCASECERNPQIGKAYFASAPEPVCAAIAEYFRIATERGELQIDNFEIAAAQFLFLVKGLPVDTKILSLENWPYSFSLEEYVASSVQTFLRAYR